jgi:DNA-binding GntR family transcriptional regulator
VIFQSQQFALQYQREEGRAVLLRDNIYDALRGAILTCDLLPGQELREQDLAKQYDVSRSPVREALLRLEGERLVTVLPRQGYVVNPVSLADARDLFGLRLVLEPACAAAAAEAASAAELRALDRFRSLDGDDADFIAENHAFHTTLARLSGNARMAAVTIDLVEQSDRLIRLSVRGVLGNSTQQLVDEHAGIVAALQARDGRGAQKLARAHVRNAQDRVLGALRRRANTIRNGDRP